MSTNRKSIHIIVVCRLEYSDYFSVYHEMEPLMKLWSLVRVNDIHVGTNKKFTLLFHNTKDIKVF